MKHRGPHQHYVVTRYAGDWTRGSVRGSFGSRVAARRYAAELAGLLSQHAVVMVLRDDQLAVAQRRGFTAYV